VKVVYSDGTSETLNPQVTGVLPIMNALDLSPIGPVTASNASTLKPTFNWQYLASPGNYLYQLWVADERNWATTWSIPSAYSASNGFTNSVSSITWGTDPTGVTNNTPTVSSMVSGDTYYWEIVAYDTNGNRSQVSGNYTPGYTALALPAANPSSLGSATLGQPYSGSIAASGGYLVYSGGYSGFSVNCSNCWGNNAVSLGRGLTANGSWGQGSLTITGTPTSAGPISFTVYVQDASGAVAGPVTYTIYINAADGLALPVPNPSSLPSTTIVNQNYSGSINVIGGVAPYSWGVSWQTSNDGLYWTTGADGSSLIIGGASSQTGTVSIQATVTDFTGARFGPVTYTITVDPYVTGYSPVYGQITFNGCSTDEPPVTLTLTSTDGGGINQTTVSDSTGMYQFPSVPNGNYTITPSITGPSSSSFSPASQPFTVSSTYQYINFNAYLGYTVSGQVTYSGADTGQVYTSLSGCGNTTPGTSISAPGAFTIHGVPPGQYTLNAWMDNTTVVSGEQLGGYGVQNASNPTGSVSNVLVPNENITNLSVGMTDPSAVTLSLSPTWSGHASGAFSGGAIVSFTPITYISSGVEVPSSYTLEYSTDSTFQTGVSSKSFPATGGKNGGFAGSMGFNGQQGGNSPWVVTGLTNNETYYFRAAGVVGSGTSAVTGPWSAPSPGIVIEAPSGGNAVSGKVTFSAPTGGSITGPLYVGYWNQNTGGIYAEEITSPVSPQAYSVSVPSGSNYFFFAFIDQNNDGEIDPGDITNTFNYNMITPSVNVAGALSNQNLTLSSANSSATIITENDVSSDYGVTNQNYALDLMVSMGLKLPVSVELLSGSNVIAPMDIAATPGGGYNPNDRFFAENIQLNSALAPTVGNAYGVKVVYSDGTSETLNPQVTNVLPNGPTNPSPAGGFTSPSTTPTFTWNYPETDAGSYFYQLYIADSAYGWNPVWAIPNVYSASNPFTSSVASIPWGADPTDPNNTPWVSTLVDGNVYWYQLTAYDTFGNRANYDTYFSLGYTALALPAPNPSSLGSATLGQPYHGSITATGGYFSWNGYVYSINNANEFWWGNISLGNGLTIASTEGNSSGALQITGTPTATGQVSFTVYVEDASGAKAGPVTYTIYIGEAPVKLNGSTTQTAWAGQSFSQTISASGGSGSGYGFSVGVDGGASNPVTGSLSLADGLSAAVNGSQLVISGTPSTPATITLSVYVQDSQNNNTTQGFTINALSPPNGANNNLLSGTYVCKMDGFIDTDGSRYTILSSFQANGAAGTITNGMYDMNGRDSNSGELSSTATGSFNIGSDNNGLITIIAANANGPGKSSTIQYAVALNDANQATTTATELRMVRIDNGGLHDSGVCYQANTAVFGTDVFAGNSFVFMSNGEDGSGIPEATLGRFVTSGGSVTGGVADDATVTGTSETEMTITGGSYTVPDATNGRSTMTVSMSYTVGANTETYTGTSEIYVIDANRMFMINTSDQKASSADVRKQIVTSYTGTGAGSFVTYEQGYDYSNPGNPQYDAMIVQASSTGTGGTVNQMYQDNNGTYSAGQGIGSTSTVSFDSNNPGRATITVAGSSDTMIAYYFNTGSSLMLDFNGRESYLATGWTEPQTQPAAPPFANVNVVGSYVMGKLPDIRSNENENIGELALASGGGMTGSQTEVSVGSGSFTWDQSLNSSDMGYSWLSTTYGAFSLTQSGTAFSTCIVIDPVASGATGKFVCIENASSSANVSVIEQ
jgi:hypothetical protein